MTSNDSVLRDIHSSARLAAQFGWDLTKISSDESDDASFEEDADTVASSRSHFKRVAEAGAELSAALQAELKRLLSAGGAKYNDMNVKVEVLARPKPSKPSAIQHLIDEILTADGAVQTQLALRKRMQAKHPGLSVPKNWLAPLPTWAKVKLQEKLLGLGIPFSTIRLPTKVTLADLHQQAKRAVLNANGGAIVTKQTLTITNDVLLIGDQAFKITTNRAKGREYRRAQIPIDRLWDLAGTPT